jgi:hypothetical protein
MQESDDALLAAAATDPDAFTGFYRRYERAVLAYFYRAADRCSAAIPSPEH